MKISGFQVASGVCRGRDFAGGLAAEGEDGAVNC